VLVEAHAIESGVLLPSATVEVDPAFGAARSGGALGSVSLPQNANSPALRMNMAPGLYRIYARAPLRNNSVLTDSVIVRAGEVTATRIDF
jgi:hypothetical protein